MVKARRAVSLGVSALIVIALILIAGFGLFLNATFNTRSTTSTSSVSSSSPLTSTTTTSSQSYPTSAKTTNSTLGLQLDLSVNQTLILSGGAIDVSVSIFNTLSTINNVTGASDWAFPSIHSTASFPCSNYLYYQVYQGYYSESNISSANSPLQVSPVYQYLSCPIFQRSYYLFQPLSDTASILVGYSITNSSTVYQNTPMTESGVLNGNYSTSYNSSVFTMSAELPPPPFPTGTYTLAAGDEWGQLAILHFAVGATTCLTTTESMGCITASSSITSQASISSATASRNNTTIKTTTLPAACSESLGLGGSLKAKTNSSTTLCVEFYYYGSQPKTFSPIGQLNITGWPSSGSTFDASSNFTVTSSVSNLTIGGASNENEGSLVIYTITPNADSSGTYLLNLGWLAVGQAPNVLDCGMEFLLVSGNGNPSYTNLTSLCITMISTGTLPNPYYSGTLFAKVVGATNSTT